MIVVGVVLLEYVSVEIRTMGVTEEEEKKKLGMTVSVVGKARWKLKMSSWFDKACIVLA